MPNRDRQARKEAIENAMNWLIQNELISYQTLYKKIITNEDKRFWARNNDKIYCVRMFDQNIFTSYEIYKIIAPLLKRNGVSLSDGISLNPTRRVYRYYITIEDLKSKISEIEKITTNHTPHFWGKSYRLTKNGTPQDVIDAFDNGNEEYIKIESDSDDNMSHHYHFGHNY